MVRALPRGVALLRVDTPIGRVLVISDRLSEHERHIAQVIAAYRIRDGARAVLLKECEVAQIANEIPQEVAA